jgi:hypothetical protein
MFIHEFRDKLVSTLSSTPIPEEITTEKHFETRFVIPVVLQVSAHQMDVHVYSHPWNNRTRCQPDCKTAREHRQTVVGCPRCWAESKEWASVLAYGTHHTFDLVAKDTSEKTLAIEIKFVAAKGGRMPNGEIQRLMGQCTLAKTKHHLLLGFVATEEPSIPDGTPTLRQLEPGMSGQESVLYFERLADFACLKCNHFVTWTNLYFHRRRVNALW